MPEYLSTTALIIAFLLSAFNLWDRIDSRVGKAREPTKALEGRIAALEKTVNVDLKTQFRDYDDFFKNDKGRIEDIEEGNKVTQKALLALLSHARDGNNIEQLAKAETELTQYLIDR